MDGGKQEKDWCVNVGVTVCVRVCVFVGVFWFKVIVWLCVQVIAADGWVLVSRTAICEGRETRL